MTKTNWQCTEHIVIMVMVAYQPQQPCWIILKEIWVDENGALKTKIQDTNFGSWLYNTAIINQDGYNWQDRKPVMSWWLCLSLEILICAANYRCFQKGKHTITNKQGQEFSQKLCSKAKIKSKEYQHNPNHIHKPSTINIITYWKSPVRIVTENPHLRRQLSLLCVQKLKHISGCVHTTTNKQRQVILKAKPKTEEKPHKPSSATPIITALCSKGEPHHNK